MLHARLRGRQVHGWLLAALLGAAVGSLAPATAGAARADDLATADRLARSGQHAEAAVLYESLGRRMFRGWDTRTVLLAAREYRAAGKLDDAERMLAKVSGPVRGDDAVLLARVEAEVALARGRPGAALDALSRVPEPWPAALAAELLGLRARAEFDVGRLLDGTRTLEARARMLGTADERHENYRYLLDELRRQPAVAVPADATPSERAWFELAALLDLPGTDATASARRASDWRTRYPSHPGGAFLPATVASLAREAAAAGLVASGPAGTIALLLPLSGRQRAAGVAVRDGFLAAALTEPSGRRPRIEIYDTAALGAGAAYSRALDDGAQAVAGPLTKEEVAAVVASQPPPVPTLALNTLPGAAPPAFLFQFALDPEQEARAAAQRIARDGHTRGIALFPSNTWGERLHAAFTAELEATGVQLLSAQYYDPGASDFSGPLRAALGRFGGAGDRDADGALRPRDPVAEARDGPQFAFLAAPAQAARALLPQLRFQMTYAPPVYATSDAFDAGPRAAPDLEGLYFPESPWILHGGQEAPALWSVLQNEWASAGRGRWRLYAFGFDAYQLLRGLNAAATGTRVGGLTGQLAIAADGRVQREPDWAQVVDGHAQVAGSLPLLQPPGEP